MFLNEPPNSQGDLKFRLLGIPVRVSPMFWVVGFLLHIGGRDGVKPIDMIAWMAAVFVSIVIHEMGHALTARHFGHRPWITLHGMGGLASYNSSNDSVSTDVKITAAGPGIVHPAPGQGETLRPPPPAPAGGLFVPPWCRSPYDAGTVMRFPVGNSRY